MATIVAISPSQITALVAVAVGIGLTARSRVAVAKQLFKEV